MSESEQFVSLAASSNGRVSGKPWKTATMQPHLPSTSNRWQERMQKTEKARAISKLQAELKEEKESELQRRRQITKERRQAAAEKKRLEDERARLGARRAARLRRKIGITKKINH